MSKGELWKGVTIRLVTAVVFGVIGGFAIWFALQMVAIFGEGMGVDARSREIYAHSHMVVHVFGAACALAIGIFYYGRNWTLVALAFLAIITCGGYGIMNMYGFTTTNRVTVAATKDAKRDAAEREYQAARTDLMGQIDWLQKTASMEEGRERRRLLDAVDAKRKELSALKPPIPTAETVISDTQAYSFASLTSTDPRTWTLTLPLPLAILMFMAESFSFIFVGHLLAGAVALFAAYWVAHRAIEPPKAAISEPPKSGSNQGGSRGSGEREPFKPTIVPKEPAEPETARAMESGSAANHAEPQKETVAEPPSSPTEQSGLKPEPSSLPPAKGKALGLNRREPLPLEVKPPIKPLTVSSALSGAPNKEWSREEVKDLLRRQRDGKAPKESSYQLADKTGVPQRTISRWQKRICGQKSSRPRRYAGNGSGMHPAAYN